MKVIFSCIKFLQIPCFRTQLIMLMILSIMLQYYRLSIQTTHVIQEHKSIFSSNTEADTSELLELITCVNRSFLYKQMLVWILSSLFLVSKGLNVSSVKPFHLGISGNGRRYEYKTCFFPVCKYTVVILNVISRIQHTVDRLRYAQRQ